ncbi:MAG: peptidylprolyl isomerase [Opitutaceae bacterium]|nr:peptidylprolyl isomerase [Opitutaceae bacterium]
MTPYCRFAACLVFLGALAFSTHAEVSPTTSAAFEPLAAIPSGGTVTIDLKSHFSVSEVPSQQLVRFVTTNGTIVVEMLADAAPLNVANFLGYVDSGTYTNTVIHRTAVFDRTTTTAAIVQGGGYKLPAPVLLPVQAQTPVALEPVLPNTRGTLAAARLGSDVNSATSEWYFNVADNTRALGTIVNDDAGNEVSVTPAYTVFGRVVAGIDTVDSLANQSRMNIGSIFQDFPYRDYQFDRPMSAANTIVVSSVERIGVYPGAGAGLLEFVAQSSDPAIVAVTVSGSTLSLQPGARLGTAVIQVKAMVLGGEVAASFNFTVSANGSLGAVAADEPGQGEVRGHLSNLSVRSFAGPGDQTPIAGFTVAGSGGSPFVLRGVGPSLASFGVPGVLADPLIELYDSRQVLLRSNDNFSGNDDGRLVGAFALGGGAKDAVISTVLEPGAYTLQVKGVGSTTGEALAEVYQASSTGASEMVNLSARASLQAGQVLVGGFSLTGATGRTVLIRAAGPALSSLGLDGAAADPLLEVYRDSVRIGENDNWEGNPSIASACVRVGAFRLGDAASKDAALLIALEPGSYTAHVRCSDGGTGTVLLEVYTLP